MRKVTALAIATGLAVSAVSAPASAKPNLKAERVQQCRTDYQTLKTLAGTSFRSVGECARYAARGGEFAVPTSLTLTLVRVGNWEWEPKLGGCNETDYPAGCFAILMEGSDLQPYSRQYWWYEIRGIRGNWYWSFDDDGSGTESYYESFVCANTMDGPIYVTGINSAGEPIKSNELDAPC